MRFHRHPGITSSPTFLDVRYRFRPNAWQVLFLVCATAAGLAGGRYLTVASGLVLALALVSINYRMRLTADHDGIRVRNYWRSRAFAWPDLADIRLDRFWGQAIVALFLNDRRKARARATHVGWAGHSYADMDVVVKQLLLMRQKALGIADPPELRKALAAAQRGDPWPLRDLLAAHNIRESGERPRRAD